MHHMQLVWCILNRRVSFSLPGTSGGDPKTGEGWQGQEGGGGSPAVGGHHVHAV